MIEAALAALAQYAVGFLVPKVAEGAAQAFGGDAYKTAIEQLKGLFSYKFAGRPELNEIQSNPDRLISIVAEEASKDTVFKSALENLVKKLQELSGDMNDVGASYLNVDSVTNLDIDSVTGSNVGGRDVIAGNQVDGGQNYFGGDHRKSTFQLPSD